MIKVLSVTNVMSEQDADLNLYLFKRSRRYNIYDVLLSSVIASLIITSTVCHIFDLYYLALFKELYYAPVFSVIIAVSASIMFVLTVTTDPGTIPRPLTPEFPPNQETTQISVMMKGKEVFRNWCRFCYIMRPLRTVHCLRCHRCVMRFDHHCPWLGNCIGLRNYRYYIWFLFWVFWIEVWYVSVCIYHIIFRIELNGNPLTADRIFQILLQYPSAIVLFIIFAMTMGPVSGLLLQHLYLTSGDFTTKERFSGGIPCDFAHLYASPYSKRNILGNFGFILCAPIFPSLTGSRFSCCNRVHYERIDSTMPFNVLYPPLPPSTYGPPPRVPYKNFGPHDNKSSEPVNKKKGPLNKSGRLLRDEDF